MSSNLYKIAQGKYFALCEGDDYWIDKNKLQKQVEFLENNKEYYATYHNVSIVDEKGNSCEEGRDIFSIKEELDIYGIKENFSKLPGQLASIVSKNFYKYLLEKKIDIDSYKTNGDMKLPIIFLSQGKIKFFKDMMSAYRRTYIGDSWNARTKNKNLSEYHFRNAIELKRLVKDLVNEDIDIRQDLSIIWLISLVEIKKNITKENLKISFNIWKKSPNRLFMINYIIGRIINKIKEWKKI